MASCVGAQPRSNDRVGLDRMTHSWLIPHFHRLVIRRRLQNRFSVVALTDSTEDGDQLFGTATGSGPSESRSGCTPFKGDRVSSSGVGWSKS